MGAANRLHLYMKAGTSNAPKYFTVQDICMLVSADQVDILLAYHATTGCYCVSKFSGHGKKITCTVF